MKHMEDAVDATMDMAIENIQDIQVKRDGRFKRTQTVLERHIAMKRKQYELTLCPVQKDILQTRTDDSQHITTALSGGRNVKQAIQHVVDADRAANAPIFLQALLVLQQQKQLNANPVQGLRLPGSDGLENCVGDRMPLQSLSNQVNS